MPVLGFCTRGWVNSNGVPDSGAWAGSAPAAAGSLPAPVAGVAAVPALPTDATSVAGTVRVDPSADLIQYLSPTFIATPSNTVPSFSVMRSAHADIAIDETTVTIPITTQGLRENIKPFPSHVRRTSDLEKCVRTLARW